MPSYLDRSSVQFKPQFPIHKLKIPDLLIFLLLRSIAVCWSFRQIKVNTTSRMKERRIRLSPNTAIQFYGVQDRLDDFKAAWIEVNHELFWIELPIR
ncbi:unnamed protein product [Lactuca virosa]|uniref:TCP domain-containing protein n=1 Tax=Lactuca virosa TaxID=75947 RepID=A0AAU9N4P9_9ASTR|nr:unnamed protein product [Lactuca virosa]